MAHIRFNPWVLVVVSQLLLATRLGGPSPDWPKQACKSRRHLRPFSLELRIREQRPIPEVQTTATRCRTLRSIPQLQPKATRCQPRSLLEIRSLHPLRLNQRLRHREMKYRHPLWFLMRSAL